MKSILRSKRKPGELGKFFYFFIFPALTIYLVFSILPFLFTIFYSFTDYTDMNPVNLSFVGFANYIYFFIFPALTIYLVFSILPFLFTIFYSFTDYTDMNPVNLSFVGFANYIKVFDTPLMMTAIKNSVVYAIALTALQTIFALPLAVLLNKKLKSRNLLRAVFFFPAVFSSLIIGYLWSFILSLQTIFALPLAVLLNKKLKSRNLLRAVFFFPAVFSSLIIGYLWSFILSSSDYGLINNLVHSLGLDTINFFSSNTALISVILTQAWQWTGWAMVIFLANLQSIPSELYEAAEIDGASGIKQFFKVTLPLMCPSVKIIVVTGLIGGMKVFDIIYSMTSGGPGNSTQTVMTVMMKKGISDGFYSTGAAFGVCFFIIVLVISGITTKLMGKWSDAI